jgi:predicted translin family RNA/ssDNA-binding protein
MHKIKRWLVRLGLVALGGGIVILARPALIRDTAKREQVEQVREQVLQANTQAQEKALQVLGESTVTTKEVIERVREVTREVTNQDPQQIINQTVTNITQEIKDLPQEQVKKVKQEVCRQILEED